MSEKQLMAPDEFRELFRRMRGHDYADWSRSAIERIATTEGWTVSDDKYPKLTVAPPLLRGSLDTGYKGADFQQLSLTVCQGASLAEFHELVAAATLEMGYEPPIWGGPGPFVRWRGDTSIEVAYDDGRVRLNLYATDVYEYYWVKSMEWGDGIHDPFPTWMVTDRHESLDGMTFPGGRVIFTWDEFEQALGNQLADFTHDIPAMGDGMSLILAPRNEPDRYVRFIVDDEDGYLIMEASAELDAADRPDAETMKALGWQDQMEREPFNFYQGYSKPTRADCKQAAKLIVATLQAYGVNLANQDNWDDAPAALTFKQRYVGQRVRGYFNVWGLYLPNH